MSNPEELQPKNRLDSGIIWAGNVLSILFLFTVLISFYEVLMRYVFNAPTIWVHETATFVGGSLFVIGGAYGLAADKHVRVVLIYDHVSERVKQYLNVFHHIMGLLFTVLLSYAAYTMVEGAWYAPWGEMRLETSGPNQPNVNITATKPVTNANCIPVNNRPIISTSINKLP